MKKHPARGAKRERTALAGARSAPAGSAGASPPPTPASQNPPEPPSAPTCPASAPAPWVYSDTVKDHFLAPRNFLMGDEAGFPHDTQGIVGNPICGDQMLMFLQIDRATDRITDLRWKTYGCASAIASTSALSELAKGKTLDEALTITPEEITAFLGGLPEHKFHCSVLGHEALAVAIKNYRAEHPARRKHQ